VNLANKLVLVVVEVIVLGVMLVGSISDDGYGVRLGDQKIVRRYGA
jgi:hypothetical protein